MEDASIRLILHQQSRTQTENLTSIKILASQEVLDSVIDPRYRRIEKHYLEQQEMIGHQEISLLTYHKSFNRATAKLRLRALKMRKNISSS